MDGGGLAAKMGLEGGAGGGVGQAGSKLYVAPKKWWLCDFHT